MNCEEKRHADWMNWRILEQTNREEKNTKLLISSLQTVHDIIIVNDMMKIF